MITREMMREKLDETAKATQSGNKDDSISLCVETVKLYMGYIMEQFNPINDAEVPFIATATALISQSMQFKPGNKAFVSAMTSVISVTTVKATKDKSVIEEAMRHMDGHGAD